MTIYKDQQSRRAIYLLIGFITISAQTLFLRELLVTFQGNELSIGFCLASWLVWTAMGSVVSGRILSSLESIRLLGLLFLAVGVLLPLTIMAIRLNRLIFQVVPGEAIGPLGILTLSFVTLGPFCFICGSLFSTSGRVELDHVGQNPEVSTSSVYLWEALGSGIGGILVSLLLVPLLTPFQSIVLLCAAALTVAWVTLVPKIRLGITLTISLFLVSGFLIVAPLIENLTNQLLWQGFEILQTVDSKYSRITVTRRESSHNLYINGVVSCTVPDIQNAEETVHFALLSHPNPRSLLMIGGGLGGGIVEAFKHPTLERVAYIEMDAELLKMAEGYFDEFSKVLQQSNVTIYLADGRRFLKTTRNRYDVVIVSVPEPLTAQLNRFYTVEFFQDVSEILNQNGVFSFSVIGSENYISEELAEYLRILNVSLKKTFRSVVLIPGSLIHFITSNETGLLRTDAELFIERLNFREIDTYFVNGDFLPFRLSREQVDQLNYILNDSEATENSDFYPVAYLARSKIWYSQFGYSVFEIFNILEEIEFSTLFGILLGILIVLALAVQFFNRKQTAVVERFTAVSSMLSAGIIGISTELILLLGFQVVYGYVFFQMILIISFFMFGIALGGGVFFRYRRQLDLHLTLSIIAGLSAILPWLTVISLRYTAEFDLPALFISWVVFPMGAVIAGFLGGLQFPLSSVLYFRIRKDGNLGVLYGVDIFGACAASVLLSGWLIPVFGLQKSAILVGLTGLLPILLVLKLRKITSTPKY